MSDHINLLGAEDVRRAASSMSSAANDMKQAASWVVEALHQHRIWMDDWLERFGAAMEQKP